MQIEKDVIFLKQEESSQKNISREGGKDSDIENPKLPEYITDPKAAEMGFAWMIPQKLNESNLPLSLESQDHNENVNNIEKQEDGNNIELFEMENVQNVMTNANRMVAVAIHRGQHAIAKMLENAYRDDCWTVETYRDKLDVLLERAEKIDNFEAKLLRSKDKMNKIEFFEVKSGREEELWENNPILVKTK